MLSRVIIPYNSQRSGGVKWYRKIAQLLIENCIYNSFIIWKMHNPGNIDHLKFRQMLVSEIISYHKHRSVTPQTGGAPGANDVLRLKERHFIRRIPIPPGCANPKKYGKRCVRCHKNGKRKATLHYCDACDKALCVDGCFELYHTKKALLTVTVNLQLRRTNEYIYI